MSDPQDCWDKLREFAQTGSNDPRKAAGAIVRRFATSTDSADFNLLRKRLEDTLIAGRYTAVPLAYLDEHSRWLAVLEGACMAAREGRSSRSQRRI
jgi:hypothetical protein